MIGIFTGGRGRHRQAPEPLARRGSRRIAAASALALVLSAAAYGLASADTVIADGDAVIPVANNGLSAGTVCTNQTVNRTALVAIDAAGHPGAGINVFADGSTVTLSVTGTSDPAVSASFAAGNTIALPSNWTSLSNSAVSSAVALTVSINGAVPPIGLHTASVSLSADGTRSTSGTLSRTASLTVSFTTQNCDSTPPDTSVSAGPPAISGSASGSFSFTGSDNVTPVGSLTFECRLDAGTFSSCTSPKVYTGLADGTHVFRVRATDAAGNTDGSPAEYSWRVDTTAPETTITAGPSSPTSSTSATVQFTGSDSGVGTVTFECRLDSASFSSCTSPKTFGPIAPGSHTIEVRAVDDAGNQDTTPDSVNWLVDTAPPSASITTHPANLTKATTAEFQFTGADDNTTPSALTFSCSLDDEPAAGCTSPQSYADLTEGDHTFSVTATDQAGNTGDPASFSWKIDTTAPQTTIVSAPSGHVGSDLASISFSGSDNVSGLGGLSFECSLDGAPYAPCTSPSTYDDLAGGVHTVQVRATDEAGNTDASPASATWLVDTTPPETTVDNGPTDPTAATTATMQFSGTDALTDAVDLRFSCSLDGAAAEPCNTGSMTYTGLAEGSHTFNVVAIDLAGNADPTPAVYSWVVDLTSPAVTVQAPSAPSGQDGWFNAGDVPVTVTVTATDPSGVTAISCTDGGTPLALDSQSGNSPRNGSLTLSADGVHAIACTAVDLVGNSGAQAGSNNTATVRIDATGPTVEVTLDRGPDHGGWYNHAIGYGASATDGASGVASCQEPAIYSGPDTATASVALSCTDLAGNSGQDSVAFQYDASSPTDVLTSLGRLPDHDGWYNHAVTVAATGTDAVSGIDACQSASYTAPDSSSATATRSCTDVAGNTASDSVDFMYDGTAPSLTPSVSPNPVVLNGIGSAYAGATDAVSGLASSGCGSIDTSTVGANSVSCSASDNAGNSATANASYQVTYATGDDCLGSPGHQVLQPINASWQTNLSVFKQGSTVPAKFRVCDANGQSIGSQGVVSKFALVEKQSLSGSEVVDEQVFSTTPDPAFRWSSTEQQWIFNMSTKNLSAKSTYVYRVTLNDGSTIDFRFGLK